MNLIRWRNKPATTQNAPTSWPITSFRSEMDRLFDRFLQDPWTMPAGFMEGAGQWMPSLDITENQNELTIRAELPGVEPEQVDVTVSGNVLTIAGEKSESSEQKDENYYHCERRFGAFRRSIELPTTVDSSKINAEYTNGVLTLHAPKLPTARPRQVEVKSTTGATQTKRVPVGAA